MVGSRPGSVLIRGSVFGFAFDGIPEGRGPFDGRVAGFAMG